ncbi:SDR family NAD(P)-dependent oxidoreductase [Verrucomicrobia bacterium]|nr:SDR family NAD(P)-dependent oxidoreductase [Verrucomicrobiota bacterium]
MENTKFKLKDKYQRALVTGGAGFIGSHLVEELLKEGLEVISVDNYLGGKKENLKQFQDYKGFKEVDCDITNYSELKKLFEDGVDIVFNQAASKKTICLKDPRRDLQINAEGAYNILELSRDYGVRKVVHASTGSVYGEAQYFPQDEKHPFNPTSYYGVSKLAGERYNKVFHKLYGLNTTILRYFHVYGPRQEHSDVGGVVTIFGRRVHQGESPIIFGDGTQQRSFTYVKDVVKINKLVALNEATAGEEYNCASGIKVTIQELAEAVLTYFNRTDLKIQYDDWTPGDIKIFDVDNSKIKSLGFEFQTEFNKGLKNTLEWCEKFLAGNK